MSSHALAIISFSSGWCICSYFLTLPPPLILEYIFNSRLPSYVHYLHFLEHKKTVTGLRLREEASAESKNRYIVAQRIFGSAVLVLSSLIVLSVLFQTFHVQDAYRLEETLTDPRLSISGIFFLFGFGCRAYRQQILNVFRVAFDIALVQAKPETNPTGTPTNLQKETTDKGPKSEGSERSKTNYADLSIPSFLQWGIAASIVVLTVLSFNPQILSSLTSLKAGALEAHFGGAAAGTSTFQSGQIVHLALDRFTTVSRWSRFCHIERDDARMFTYKINKLNETVEGPRLFYLQFIRPFFESLRKVEENDDGGDAGPCQGSNNGSLARGGAPKVVSTKNIRRYMSVDMENSLKEFSMRLSNLVINFNASRDIHLEQPVRLGTQLAWSTELQQLYMQTKLFECYAEDDRAGDLVNLDRDKGEGSPCKNYARSFGFKIFEKIPRNALNDPFIIQSIGDLLFFGWGKDRREHFLAEAYSKTIRQCAKGCPILPAGELSLKYAVVLAKIRSDRPWPLEEMISQLNDALRGINAVLDENQALRKPKRNTDAWFRRSRLASLALGLELFYQRSLMGHHFTTQQTQLWRDWLTEADEALSLTEDAGTFWPSHFDAAQRSSWRDAKALVQSSPDLGQDAAVGVALGSVLIEAQSGPPSSLDCLRARASFNYASKLHLEKYFDAVKLNSDEKSTYKGFLEEVNGRIGGRCDGV